MQRRLVVPALVAGLSLVLTSCVNPPSRTPDRSAPSSVATTSAPAAAEPSNLYLLKQELKAYVDSGRYDAGIAAVAAEAKQWVETRAAQGGGKLAVVFDLDETLLSNMSHMVAMDYGYIPKKWDEWIEEAQAPAIAPVREVYLAARAHNIAVIFITGRRTGDKPGTENNLRSAGIGGYTRIFYKSTGDHGTTEAFKTATRRKLVEEEGYTIIANIGDQVSDLAGGYAERTFKLPNPFYLAK